MTDEANIAEAELAKVIREATDQEIIDAFPIARAILAAGYRKRSDVLEEAAKVADLRAICSEQDRMESVKSLDGDSAFHLWACNAAKNIAQAIRSLKGQP